MITPAFELQVIPTSQPSAENKQIAERLERFLLALFERLTDDKR